MADHSASSCCPNENFTATRDYNTTFSSAQRFMERAGIVPTYRNPGPRIQIGASDLADLHPTDEDAMAMPEGEWRVNTLPPAETGLPLPDSQRHLDGEPAPDRAQTLPWPHPSRE